jgi:hypothetical protein
MKNAAARKPSSENQSSNSPWNLREGGHRGYRAVLEAKVRRKQDRVYEIPCRKGGRFGEKRRAHIYAHSRTHYGFSGVGMRLRRALLAIPGVEKWQTGDEEFSVIFPAALFDAVAGLVKPLASRKAPEKAVQEGFPGVNFNEEVLPLG